MIGVIKIRMVTLRLPFVSEDVAGGRHCTQGKIKLPSISAEIDNSECELTSFLYKKKSTQQIRLIEPTVSKIEYSECKKFLSGISLIIEIILD